LGRIGERCAPEIGVDDDTSCIDDCAERRAQSGFDPLCQARQEGSGIGSDFGFGIPRANRTADFAEERLDFGHYETAAGAGNQIGDQGLHKQMIHGWNLTQRL
jgi:hypothetical protein